jgi:hypothetical protein
MIERASIMAVQWKHNAGVVWEELDGETLLVNPITRATVRLNETASFVWKHCSSAITLSELARTLARKSGRELRRIEHELEEFCLQLSRGGFLQPATRRNDCLSLNLAAFTGSYEAPRFFARSLGHGPRKRPSPRGNSGPG